MKELAEPEVDRFVFIDDFVGGGTQAERYSRSLISPLKKIAPKALVSYLALFATDKGLAYVRKNTDFDFVECIFELDASFRCFDSESRYFVNSPAEIDKNFASALSLAYGQHLYSSNPFGHSDCQLLIGFHHNVPNNTLPIFWADGVAGFHWSPIFRRYSKGYGWGA
jgi:hypothetical protein